MGFSSWRGIAVRSSLSPLLWFLETLVPYLKLDFGKHEFGVQRPVTTVLIGATVAWCGFDHHNKRDKTKISDREKIVRGDEARIGKQKENLIKMLVYLCFLVQ